MKLPVGNYIPRGDQPALRSTDTDVVERFHDLYYSRWLRQGADTLNLSWFGFRAMKCPLDLWVYQELIVSHRPDFVIETGTQFGGSALFLASIFDLLGKGSVISVDVEVQPNRPSHPRITYLRGSSTDPTTIERIKNRVGSARVMVILDSDHSKSHVLQEIGNYAPFVQVGDYLIIEDTNINGHPTFPEYGPGPMEAVETFLARSDEFEVDPKCERFMLTFNPKGYLRRVKPATA